MAGGLAEASGAAARMVAALGSQFEIDGNIIHVSPSIGIAVAPSDGDTHEQLLRHADLALYRAKASGRGCFLAFETDIDTVLQARRTLEQDLRVALAEGQFELAYQPQVRVQDDRIIGFEALLRWLHPTQGVIPPDSFIPTAEDSGLIVPIDVRRAAGLLLQQADLR
nr:EAL domain-containing protein [uncultured Lichenicoccus sp.]